MVEIFFFFSQDQSGASTLTEQLFLFISQEERVTDGKTGNKVITERGTGEEEGQERDEAVIRRDAMIR